MRSCYTQCTILAAPTVLAVLYSVHRTWLHRPYSLCLPQRLKRLGGVQADAERAALASLVGGGATEETAALAEKTFRLVPFSALRPEDLPGSGSGPGSAGSGCVLLLVAAAALAAAAAAYTSAANASIAAPMQIVLRRSTGPGPRNITALTPTAKPIWPIVTAHGCGGGELSTQASQLLAAQCSAIPSSSTACRPPSARYAVSVAA